MGAVHGVYLKYVGLSALSLAGYTYMVGSGEGGDSGEQSMMFSHRMLALATSQIPMWRLASAAILGYSAILNGAIATMFQLKRGMSLVGKNRKTGQIPLWSYILYFPFHGPTYFYTYVHTKFGTHKVTSDGGETKRQTVPVASEVQPGWWVGGCYANELDRDWAGIIDLTVEFPERCIGRTESYLLIPTWDGVPADPAQLEEAATFAANARKRGDVIVHCAHGRGRSTTVMCAALVRAGLFQTWEEAFEKGIKPGRSVCKLNAKMRRALTEWQRDYVDAKKQI
uniref:Tyrosine specific protein phosphatases domain-containing protein n=1 Tax=Ditylum brightwellii TaxID=49249 RepID=A0A7S4SVA9_9STRA